MKLLLLLVSLLQLAPATDAPFALEVSLAKPPACARASSLTVGTISVPAAAPASGELHLVLCDGRTVDLHAEVERTGDTFFVLATSHPDNGSSNSFLLVGQSFDATLSDLRLRFTVNQRARP